MSNVAVVATISDFTVLPLTYPSSLASTHHLYIRRHKGSKTLKRFSKGGDNDGKHSKNEKAYLPDGRTLFAVNMPPDATEREVVLLLKFCGTVEKVVFDFMAGSELQDDESGSEDEEETTTDEEQDQQDERADGKGTRKKKQKTKKVEEVPKVVPLPPQNIRKLRKTGRTAHIVFLDASSLDRLFSSLAAPAKPRVWPTSEAPIGLAHYIAQYDAMRPPLDAIKEHADSYIRVYDYELEKTRQKSKYRKGEAIVDEDGFTLVVRGGAYGQTLGGGVAVASKKFQRTGVTSDKGARKRRKANEDKEGFYAFQKAEKQRNGTFYCFGS
ncbi:hypothetical protein AX15_000595 [Amanita polypyramis BW_CC]|nr:hypothetical protein AX15_000595 [Amanita polypyramis BW_CC]